MRRAPSSLAARPSSRDGRFRLLHALLASLPVQVVVLATSDERFEAASSLAGREKRTVLRLATDLLGGCAEPEKNREALRGLLQTTLAHHHLLLCGCAGHVAEAVRAALREPPAKPWGTVVAAQASPLLAPLFPGADVVGMSRDGKRGAVELEIFCDYLAARSSSAAAHIFEPAFDCCAEEDLAFKNSVTAFAAALSEDAKKSASFSLFKSAMRDTFPGLQL